MQTTIPQTSTEKGQPPALKAEHTMPLSRWIEQIGVRIFLIVICILFLIPVFWMLVTALKTNQELTLFPPSFWPFDVRWDNFVKAYNFIPFGRYFLNSVLVTLVSVIGSVASNLLVAYGFSCIRWPGRDLVFYLIIATIFIPFPVAAIPLFDLFAKLKWVDTLLPLTVPAFLGSAFYTFLLRQFLLQIPYDMIEAARIDGATELQILVRVIIPQARPALAVIALFTAIASWNDFMGPLIYVQNDLLRTLAIGLQFFRTTHDVQFNLLMAASLVAILPIIILFLLFQRFFVKGVSMGSIR
ncbi:carbohydrate ABC transporter permease [Ktedonosporobacter rubrisoli]|uniref:Carbohydrate ABC transporter permease n=1 Tax=Ktedonosporobacter rubrisoli TaxID=2509675 RepID=A0A4P6K4W1_KTERU|nr:carbohydrate ABC transporter permease [Ktedonosporobacter rubrisoli]QBD82963.1 carbohydrate ABC transporter permease [Ktedonosporobacter rubrisoli]